MRLEIFGPELLMTALGEMVKLIPATAEHVIFKCPLRKSVRERACQFPGRITYDASVDNRIFIHLIQDSPTGKFEITVS